MSSRVRYGSARLLVEAVDREMENVRRAAMGNMALGPLNELRDLVAQLSEKASRIAVDDLPGLPATEYVAKMKPVVADYHRALAANDLLAQCLCMDMRASGCVLVMLGDDKTSVKAAHDPGKPGAEKAVGALLAALDDGARRVAELAYWREGAKTIEAARDEAIRQSSASREELMLLDDAAADAVLCNRARAAAYQHALEMMAPPIGDPSGFAGISGPPEPPLDSLALETRPLTLEVIEQGARQTLGVADEPEMDDEDGWG